MDVIPDQSLPGTSIAHADTKIIPSISALERYDSNVFISPSEFIPAGKKRWDLVTSVVPQVDVQTKGRQITSDVYAGVSGNVFINNPELNFISVNAGGLVNLDGFVGQYIRGLKLQIADNFFFTPEPPSFITGIKPQATQDPFARGVVATRANTYTNTGLVAAQYPLSHTVGIAGTYTNSIFKVGQIFTAPAATPGAVPISFFNTFYQTWSLGPSIRLTRSDTMNIKFQRTSSDLSRPGTSQTFSSFAADGFAVEYRKATPEWTATVSGGATVLEQAGVSFFSGQLTFTGAVDPSTRMRVSISRQVAPAFFGAGAAYISTAATASIERRLSKVLSLTGNANYGVNETTPVNILTFHSFTGAVGIKYAVTRTVSTSLSYDYMHFRINQPGLNLLTDRSFVSFTINALWK